MEESEEHIVSPLFIETPLEVPLTNSPLEKFGVHALSAKPHGEEFNDDDDSLSTIIEDGLYQLGLTADGTSQVYLNLSLKAKNLDNVNCVEKYGHLQVLDISENQLTDLNPLKCLPYLISLNASHNQLTSIISFNPPIGLREVNFSYNHINEIGDLSCHSLLCTLLLDNNLIEEIKGIDQCYALSNISISHNKLTKISGLEGLPIKQLDLSNNYIRKIENLQTLKNLQYINLGYNQLRSLRGLQEHEVLEDINLRYNQIIDISEIRYLRGLKLLRILNLDGNAIQEINDYRLSILFRIPALMELDVAPILCEEKVAAVNLFKPSLDLITTADHMENLLKSYLNPTLLLHTTLPTNDPFPILVIVGPLGMGKKFLAQKIAEEFHNCFGICVGHTTRAPATQLLDGKVKVETDGEPYHFIAKEVFEVMKAKGEFLQTCTLYGSSFGITGQSIESVAEQNLACILTMELEGIMTLKKTHFKPRCILVIPEDVENYKHHLQNTNRYNESEIFESTHKVSLYTEVNQMHPGYFDATIMTDSFEERCDQLKNTVKTYLDITPPNSVDESSESRNSKTTPCFRMTSIENTSRPSSFSLTDSKRGKQHVHPQSSAVANSYQRRYEKTRAALMGVTSSFQDQLEKIKRPRSSPAMPFVRGYQDLLNSCTSTEEVESLSSNSECDDGAQKSNTGVVDCDVRLTSELTTDTVLRYQDFDEIELE